MNSNYYNDPDLSDLSKCMTVSPKYDYNDPFLSKGVVMNSDLYQYQRLHPVCDSVLSQYYAARGLYWDNKKIFEKLFYMDLSKNLYVRRGDYNGAFITTDGIFDSCRLKFCLRDKNLKTIIDNVYKIEPLMKIKNEIYYLVAVERGCRGYYGVYLNRDGTWEEIVKCQYTQIEKIHDGFIHFEELYVNRFHMKYGLGVIENNKFQIIYQGRNDIHIKHLIGNLFAVYPAYPGRGVVLETLKDNKLEEVRSLDYDQIDHLLNNVFEVRKDGVSSIIKINEKDYLCKNVCSQNLDEVKQMSNNLFRLSIKENHKFKYGVLKIDKDTEEIIVPIEYSFVSMGSGKYGGKIIAKKKFGIDVYLENGKKINKNLLSRQKEICKE